MTYQIHTHQNLRRVIIAFIFSVVISGKQAIATTSALKKVTGSFKTETDTARFSFSGRVVDEKGEPLPGATIFISNSKWAASANSDGVFKLSGIPPGNYEVLVRMMGFITFSKVYAIIDKSVTLNVTLKSDAIALNEVKITEKPDPNRARYLKLFKQNLIGESDNGKKK